MGRLWWRERWSVLGCRRGWIRLLPFVAFVLVGYFSLYAWLRATNEIEFAISYPSGLVICGPARSFVSAPGEFQIYYIEEDRRYLGGQPMWLKAMRPAMEMELVLHRRGWMQWALTQ